MIRTRLQRRWAAALAPVPFLLALLTVPASADVDNRASLKADLCYQVVTDRFADGDPANNDPARSAGLYDPSRSNWKLYVAVWFHVAGEPAAPRVGSAGPTLTRAGNTITVEGRGFGAGGTLAVGGVAAPVSSWEPHRIVATVPAGVEPGVRPVTVTTGAGTSNGYELRVLSGPQVPVTSRSRTRCPPRGVTTFT